MNEFLLGTLWLLYYGLHSFMAAEGTKRFLKSFLGDSFRYYRLFYTLFAAINFGLLFFLQSILPSPELFDTHAATKITAALVFAGGVWVVLGVVRRFPFSFWFVDSAPSTLITDGWYAVVRHPMGCSVCSRGISCGFPR